MGGIDGEDRALEAVAQQVLEDGAAHTALALGGPDHRHPLGAEEGVERPGLGAQEVVGGIAGLGGGGFSRHLFNIYFRPV